MRTGSPQISARTPACKDLFVSVAIERWSNDSGELSFRHRTHRSMVTSIGIVKLSSGVDELLFCRALLVRANLSPIAAARMVPA
jgi:hypothetical protein